jgi:hypothetical protein
LTACPGELPTWAVVSVWPKPSRRVIPQAALTWSMTSGFSGSPAPISSRTLTGYLREVFLDQHPPHRWRRAEGGHRASDQRFEDRRRGEARVVVDEYRCAGVPGREKAAPGVLRPAGRTDVPMHVARLQSEPVHGRQMPDRITLLAVQHQFGFRGRAGGEIEQLRVGRQRRAVGFELARPLVSVFELLASRRPPHRR